MGSETPIRVVLADDHGIVLEGLAKWLNNEPDLEVVAMVGSADEAIAACASSTPDILIIDIDMPGRLTIEAVRVIRARMPGVAIVFLSAHTHDSYIADALRVEARGYLTKRESPAALADAIRRAVAGEAVFSKEIEDRLIVTEQGIALHASPTRFDTLTPREIEVLRYLAQGRTKKNIAAEMSLSPKTIDNHTTSIMNKLDLHNRVELTRFAIRENLVNL